MLPSQSEPCRNSKHWFTTSWRCRKAMLGVWAVPSPIGKKGHFIMLPSQSHASRRSEKKDIPSIYHHSQRHAFRRLEKKGHYITLPLQSEPWFSLIGKKGHYIMLPLQSELCLFTAETKGVNRRRALVCPGVAGPCATRPCQCRSTRSRGYLSVVRVPRLSLTAGASGGTQVGREDWGFVRATVSLRCSMHPLAVRHRLNDITFAVD